MCNHPAHRLFAWHVGDILCVGCCECGEVLQGGATLDDEPEPEATQ